MYIDKIIAVVIDDRGEEQRVVIEPCHGSFEQFGAPLDVLAFTCDLAEAVAPYFGVDADDEGGKTS